MPPDLTSAAGHILARYADLASPSARVLLTTVFGDALLPRDQAVGVQSLAALMLPLGINERGVRTALQRLSSEEIVIAERVGRRSFYRVHPDAIATFERANKRIHARLDVAWDGSWTIAVLDRSDSAGTTARLDRELRWLGMAPLTADVMVSASVSPDEVTAVGRRVGGGLAAVMRGPLGGGSLAGDDGRRALVDPSGELDKLYRQHCETFEAAIGEPSMAPVDAFIVRTLVVDSWRRIALRSAEVPPELEPSDWPATNAFKLTASLLDQLQVASERHLNALLGPATDVAVATPSAEAAPAGTPRGGTTA